jgi:hypothetical protein
VQAGVKSEIKRAMKLNNHIIFVEYNQDYDFNEDAPHSPTLDEIYSLANNYNNKGTVIKGQNDGSCEIQEYLEDKLPDVFRVCGVNTDACVMETVSGLVEETESTVQVIRKACGARSARSITTECVWAEFGFIKNERLQIV